MIIETGEANNMAKQKGNLTFNDYSTEVNESKMIMDLILQPNIAQEPEYAALLEVIRRRTEGVRVYDVTFYFDEEITIEKPSEGGEE